MFERYTEKARRVIFYARYEASQFGTQQMETEHLLLGLLQADPEFIARLLREGETAETIRARVHERTPKHPRISTSIDLPLSETFRQVLSDAEQESARLQHDIVGTEHVVIALLLQEHDPAARFLVEAGASLAAGRQIVEEMPLEELRRRGGEKSAASLEFLKRMQEGGSRP